MPVFFKRESACERDAGEWERKSARECERKDCGKCGREGAGRRCYSAFVGISSSMLAPRDDLNYYWVPEAVRTIYAFSFITANPLMLSLSHSRMQCVLSCFPSLSLSLSDNRSIDKALVKWERITRLGPKTHFKEQLFLLLSVFGLPLRTLSPVLLLHLPLQAVFCFTYWIISFTH